MKDLQPINRGIILVIPKKSYYDWANKIFPESPLDETSFFEHNSYLVSSNLFFDEPVKALKKYWKDIFENELFLHVYR